MNLAVLRRRRWSLAWLLAILLVGIGLGILASIPLLRGANDGKSGSLVGSPAPALSAEGLDGRTWTLRDADGRVVWVNFWATWCPPCRTEMPAMEALAERYAGELLILGVDWGEERAMVEDFVARYEISYPILLDPTLENYYRWSPQFGLPRHYFIGTDGTVVREIVGPLEPNLMVEILRELLGPAT